MTLQAHISVRATTVDIWAAILALHQSGQAWTTAEIRQRTTASGPQVSEYVKRLTAGGFVSDVGSKKYAGRRYRLFQLERSQRDAPRFDRDGVVLPERIVDIVWRTIKMLRTGITTTALAEAVEALGRETNREHIGNYVRKLAEVGVLKETSPKRGQAPAEYRLVMKLGAAAPQVLKADLVYDPNAKQMLGVAEARDPS